MKNHGENSQDEVTRQDKKLLALIVEHFPIEEMSKEYKQFLIENHYNLIKLTLQKTFVPSEEAAIKVWFYYFYLKYFNRKIDVSAVKIPDYQDGFDWIIIIAQGLTISRVVEVLKKYKLYDGDLSDEDILINDRSPEKDDYAVRFRKRVEADEELQDRSGDDLEENNVASVTVLERLIMELAHYEDTDGQHLDIDNWTLCSGSRYSNGDIPDVHWSSNDDKLDVHWTDPDDAYDYLRSREAVS